MNSLVSDQVCSVGKNLSAQSTWEALGCTSLKTLVHLKKNKKKKCYKLNIESHCTLEQTDKS